MINPRQGFQHTSNVSAILTECQKKNLYGMWRFVQHLSLPHLNAKTLVKTASPGVKGEDTERGEPLSRTAVGETTCTSWAGDTGPPEEACTVCTLKPCHVRNQRWNRIKVKEKQRSCKKHKGLQYLHASWKREKSESKPHSWCGDFTKNKSLKLRITRKQ